MDKLTILNKKMVDRSRMHNEQILKERQVNAQHQLHIKQLQREIQKYTDESGKQKI